VTVHEILDSLQKALHTHVRTGELTLKITDGKLISLETRTYARILPREVVDSAKQM
jgi:hypothetical protein